MICEINKLQCLFCSLQQQNTFLYRDECFFIIKDKHPKAKHHYLIVTIKHITNLLHIKYEDFRIMQSMFKCVYYLQTMFRFKNMQITINNGKPYQEIMHFHAHVMSDSIHEKR